MHFANRALPLVFAEHAASIIQSKGLLTGLPVATWLSSKSALLRIVQDAWHRYLANLGMEGSRIGEPSPPDYVSKVDVPFAHSDVQSIVDSMFLNGSLHPLAVELVPAGAPGWIKAGIVQDPQARNAFVMKGIAKLTEAIPGATATHTAAALCWGVAVACYPFFGKVAELVGRLSAIQDDCAAAEVHRRMSEIYGEREGTRRTTNMVIQTQASWGAVARVEKGKRIVRLAQTDVQSDELTMWLIEAALRYVGKNVSIHSLQSQPVLFPFSLNRPLAYVVSNCPYLDIRSEGPNNQFVALRSTF